MAVAAAVGAAGAIGAAAISSRSAKKAAESAGEAQSEAALTSVAEQRRQFDISQQQLAPFRQAGLGALQQQLALLGLPGLDPSQFGPSPGAAAQTRVPQPGTSKVSLADRQRLFRSVGGRDPRREQFREALLGDPVVAEEPSFFPPAVSREDALAAFAETPGQQFLRERQERALLRSAGAIGGLGGGNIRTALQEQAFGRAATQLGEFQNRLAALSGGAQTATTNIAQLGAQTAGQIGQGLQTAGAARASGILGAQQARAQGIQGIAGALGGAFSGGFGGGGGGSNLQFVPGSLDQVGAGVFSDVRLKQNIVKIGELSNGLNWYNWIWSDEAKGLVGSQDNEGVIAQEVKKLFPDAVFEENGYLKVRYDLLH